MERNIRRPVRLLTKFVENEYEKVDRLLDIRTSLVTRVRAVEKQNEQELQEITAAGEQAGEEEELAWYARLLDGGLYTLQTADYILAWICMEDDGVRATF